MNRNLASNKNFSKKSQSINLEATKEKIRQQLIAPLGFGVVSMMFFSRAKHAVGSATSLSFATKYYIPMAKNSRHC